MFVKSLIVAFCAIIATILGTQYYNMYAAAFDPINNLPTLFEFFLVGSLSNLVTFYHNFDVVGDQFKAKFYDTEDTFDFIVVGAGSAGSVVANRLSEEHTVLLIEAGGEPSPILEIPAFFFPMLGNPHMDWGFKTVPQQYGFLSATNRQGNYTRGLGLGGTSNVNGMIYLRGHPNDYDGWAKITGDSRWSWENVLPAFKNLEDYHGQWENSMYHSQGGDIKVSANSYAPLAEDFVKAGIEMGYEEADLNGRFTNGFLKAHFSQHEGRRFGAYQAFLEPARKRKNLTIHKFAMAHKILFKDPENVAYGIEYERHGVRRVAFANKEIIISAGAIMTPHLLMHSGIGPRSHLETHNIPVIVDLPVGQNLQDHIAGIIGPFLTDTPKTSEVNFDEYRVNGTGPLSTSGISAKAYLVSLNKTEDLDWPDMQLTLLDPVKITTQFVKEISQFTNIPESTLWKYYGPAEGKDTFIISAVVARPKSRGEITLASSDPNDYPLFNPNYLSAPEDMKLLIEGAHRVVNLVENTTVFQAMNAHLHPTVFPGCENLIYRSDEYWECYYRRFTFLYLHAAGSAPMGNEESKKAVVDTELRVFGTKGLRVIDTSIMPAITTGNTNAPAMMIGEMGSSFIKSYWSSGKPHM